MKSLSTLLAIITILAATAFAASNAQQSFEQLKSLEGNWEGRMPNGEAVNVSFKVMGNGSSLVSEIKGKENMISVFHMDKDRLLITHYCSAGNQPRMEATISPDGKTITFNFVDGTNITSQQAGHMRQLVISMPDADHHVEDWIFAANDGKSLERRFDLERQK